MEELQSMLPPTSPIATPDQEMFDRVWGRVMAQTPIKESAPTPEPGELPCLGEGSVTYSALLEELLDSLHADWQTARSLSRQSRQAGPLAQELQSQQRQLGTAYFLITGQRYLPGQSLIQPRQTLPLTLRELFIRARQRQYTLDQWAARLKDPCLKSLFEQLAKQSLGLMDRIRTSLEVQM